jgi:DNA-directed RNA polymerase subunit RPC12/RpoP
MPNAVFEVICPTCGGKMSMSGSAEAACRSCGRQFLVRVGHLIPVPVAAEGAS